MRVILSATIAAAMAAATVVVATPAAAAGTPVSQATFVQYVAMTDSRALVRSAAWAALLGSPQDELVARFIASDRAYVEGLAAEVSARNADFAEHVLATHLPTYSPEVHAAARAALDGSDAMRQAFAAGGYTAALDRDRRAREAAGEQREAIVQADRNFVARLRDYDPGPQVRVYARVALDGTDADLVEFFSHGWAFGASLDLQAYRSALIESDHAWVLNIDQLTADAEAAEAAARKASGDAARPAREVAARAWQTVGDKIQPAAETWEAAKRQADGQVATWQAVVAAAAGPKGPNWAAVAAMAVGNHAQWTGELDLAAGQAPHWQRLLAQARASERDMREPVA